MNNDENAIDEREIRVLEAIKACRRAHLDRYGFDDVNEAYISGLPDAELDLIIAANKAV